MNLDQVSVEAILDAGGATYRLTSGAHGAQINVRECPRCGDARYKVYINRESGLGNCWVCPPGENTFNKYTLARALFGAEAHRRLEDVVARHRWLSSPASPGRSVDVELALPDSVPLPYLGMLPEYLVQRGVTAELARYFELRWCANGAFRYGEGHSMDFSQRVLFPIRDVSGTLVSFQGRDITGAKASKYLFPPGFSVSGRTLYNAHRATSAEVLILTEGVFDAIAVKRALNWAGLAHMEPIASFGKHFNCSQKGQPDQLDVLLTLRRWFGINHILFAWDGTPDASRAAVLAMRALQRRGFKTAFVKLPAGKDPNEITEHELIECIHRATPYSEALVVEIELGAFQ